MRPNRRSRPTTPTRPPDASPTNTDGAKPADGAFQAMDQVANWVRFADTKATILTAGLGVVLTMLMTNAKTVSTAIKHEHCWHRDLLIALAALTLGAAAYTLFQLVRAISPSTTTTHPGLNRFAWPTLSGATLDALTLHKQQTEANDDAWKQVIDLSAIAQHKFSACSKATKGFAALVVLGIACVTIATALTT